MYRYSSNESLESISHGTSASTDGICAVTESKEYL